MTSAESKVQCQRIATNKKKYSTKVTIRGQKPAEKPGQCEVVRAEVEELPCLHRLSLWQTLTSRTARPVPE